MAHVDPHATRRRARRARGAGASAFTLLETMLAAVVAGVIVVAVAGVFASMESMNERTHARFMSWTELSRARTVVARAIDSLLMSAEPQRAQGATQERPPARVVLEVDEGTGRAARGGDAPQRFEMVLSRWPVPRAFVDERRAAVRDRVAESVPPPGPGSPLRCAFELRPGADRTWTLWWRPLPLPEDGGGPAREMDPADDPNAVPLVTGLIKCRWTVFDDRERKSTISSAWATELPAYIELDIATADGATGNWMFEVAWTNGKELPDDAGPAAPGTEGEAAPTTGPGGRAVPTRPGGRGSGLRRDRDG